MLLLLTIEIHVLSKKALQQVNEETYACHIIFVHSLLHIKRKNFITT